MSGYATPPSFTEINSGYAWHLLGTDENGGAIDVYATVPETFSLHIQSAYEPLLPFGNLAGGVGEISPSAGSFLGKLDDTSRRLLGYSGQVPALSQLIWASTSPIDLHFPLQFNAISDASSEVMQPLQQLLALQCPSVVDGILRGPGPSLFGNSQYNLYLHLGASLVFSNVIVVDVAANLDTMVENDGDYISVQVDVTISTGQIITKDVLANIFSGQQVDNPSAGQALQAVGSGLLSAASKAVSGG